MRISAQITLDDHRDLAALLLRRDDQGRAAREAASFLSARKRGIVLGMTAFVGLLAFAAYQGVLKSLLEHPLIVVLIVIGLAAIPVALAWLFVAAKLRHRLEASAGGAADEILLRDGLNMGAAQFELTDEGICVNRDLIQETYEWAAFQTVEETSGLLCLMIDEGKALMVPKRAFPNHLALQDFKATVASRLEATP